MYLADIDATVYEYLLIANAAGTATTARLTFVRPDGSRTTRDVAVAANSRLEISVPAEAGLTGPGVGGRADPDLTHSVPLQAEHFQYQPNRGRGSEGVSPGATWYLAEGNVSTFEEYVTVFNVEPVAVRVTFLAYRPDGTTVSRDEIVSAGPGRTRLRVRDWTTLGRRPGGGADGGDRVLRARRARVDPDGVRRHRHCDGARGL